MRSRYSAYAKHLPVYLARTWAAGAGPDQVHLDEAIRWVGLDVLATSEGGAEDRTGTVEFSAAYELDGRAGVLHEVSWFRREGTDDAWRYVGEQRPAPQG